MFKYARVKLTTQPLIIIMIKKNNSGNKYNDYDILQLYTFLGGYWRNVTEETDRLAPNMFWVLESIFGTQDIALSSHWLLSQVLHRTALNVISSSSDEKLVLQVLQWGALVAF